MKRSVSDRPVWQQVLRAAALPFLLIGLVAGSVTLVWLVQVWQDLEANPPEGHAAGFVGMAVILGGLVALLVAGGSAVALWAMWRPRKQRSFPTVNDGVVMPQEKSPEQSR